MSWFKQRLAAFDLETTGVDTRSDRIVTAAVSLVGGGQPTDKHSWLVDPGVDIPAGATAVHGITTEMARAEGAQPSQAVEEIVALLASQVQAGVPVVAFNARFDLTLLDREARRHNITPLVERVGGEVNLLVVDPLVLDKQYDRFRRGKRTLTDVCGVYNIQLDDAHEANADAIAAARIAYRMATRIPELAALELSELHQLQVGWAREQAESLQEYFHSQGKDEHIEVEWPTLPLAAAA